MLSPSPPSDPNNSPSPWLDRLRSSNKALDSPPPDLSATHDDPSSSLLPHILSDLFCFAPSSGSHLPRNRLPRKQPNPRSFSLPLLPPASLHDNTSPPLNLKDEVVPSSNSDNTTTTEPVEFNKPTPDVDVGWGGGDVDDEEEELTGYSRSEVTVIDTSCDVWKSDRVVFRRRNVWKIRAKKGRLRSYGRKKRNQEDTHDLTHGISVTASGNNNANAFSFQDLSCSNPSQRMMPVATDSQSRPMQRSQDRSSYAFFLISHKSCCLSQAAQDLVYNST